MATSDHDKDADYEEGSFIDRIKESPRTVSALIIILIVAAAIYAFSGDDAATPTGETDQAAVTTEESSEESNEAETATEEAAETEEVAMETTAPSAPVTQDQLRAEAQQLPEPRRTDAGYVEVAQAGDGITHLSRRAVTRWLAANQAGYEVTNEHRIFIEDYIQNRVGSHGLSLGQEQEISFELIKEAVEAANQLNQNQLKNLSQYTYVLT